MYIALHSKNGLQSDGLSPLPITDLGNGRLESFDTQVFHIRGSDGGGTRSAGAGKYYQLFTEKANSFIEHKKLCGERKNFFAKIF
jgi:hypothetical protein